MRKFYFKPAMRVVELKYNGIICQSLRSAPNNADINDEIQSDDVYQKNGGVFR